MSEKQLENLKLARIKAAENNLKLARVMSEKQLENLKLASKNSC